MTPFLPFCFLQTYAPKQIPEPLSSNCTARRSLDKIPTIANKQNMINRVNVAVIQGHPGVLMLSYWKEGLRIKLRSLQQQSRAEE